MNLKATAPRIFVLSASLWIAACTAGAQATQSQILPMQTACFVSAQHSVTVNLEWAETAEQRRIGLMGREHLGERAGMLFDYAELQPAEHSFWMRNTLIPLDIAFIDEQGTIVAINHMVPCDSVTGLNCPTYLATAAFVRAVEMNAGFFMRYQLAPGDRFEAGSASCAAAP